MSLGQMEWNLADVLKDDAEVVDKKKGGGLHSLNPNERGLLLQSVASKAIAQLVEPVAGADDHQERGEGEEADEGLGAGTKNLPAVVGVGVGVGMGVGATSAEVTDEVVGEEGEEHGEGEELEREAEQREVDPQLGPRRAVRVPAARRLCRHPCAHRLEDD